MEIILYDEIERGSAGLLIEAIKGVQEPITLRINSPGGDVFEALALYNYLLGKGVEIIIDGICGSAATIVACGGSKVTMGPSALMMIHNPTVMLFDAYDAKGLEALQTTLEKITDSIVAVYRRRVANYEMPEREQWLTAEQAKALGFVDEVAHSTPQMQMLLSGGRIKHFAGQVKNSIDKTITDNINSGAAQVVGNVPVNVRAARVRMLADKMKQRR